MTGINRLFAMFTEKLISIKLSGAINEYPLVMALDIIPSTSSVTPDGIPTLKSKTRPIIGTDPAIVLRYCSSVCVELYLAFRSSSSIKLKCESR